MQPLKPYQEKRPWGGFIEYTRNTPSTVKIITVNPGEAFSLQTHHNRDEFWHILSGEGVVTIGDQKIPAQIGDDHFIPRETPHRMEASSSPLVFLEISFGEFSEEDITRLEDKYGRA